MAKSSKKEKSTGKWLDKLQRESWQLELLISGFAIFGLFELGDYLSIQMISVTGSNVSSPIVVFQMFALLFLIIINAIFILNLLVHVFIRGLWIGAIGLRYVSGDIDYKALRFNSYFEKYFKKSVGSFDEYIISLEKLASVIFSFTFLLAFIFISIFIFFLEIIALLYVLKELTEYLGITTRIAFYISMIILFFALLMFIDFLTLSYLKRIKQKHFSKLYLFFYKLISKMTLSFAWRPILLNFLDQKYTRKLLIFVLPYIIILFSVSTLRINKFGYFPTVKFKDTETFDISHKYGTFNQYYDDRRKPIKEDIELGRIRIFSLPSFEISKNTFECFISYDSKTESFIKQQAPDIKELQSKGVNFFNLDYSDEFTDQINFKTDSIMNTFEGDRKSIKKQKRAIRDSLSVYYEKITSHKREKEILRVRDIIAESIILTIDDIEIPKDSIQFFFYNHPYLKEEGMRCFFPIHFRKGIHTFTYKKVIVASWNDNLTDTIPYSIPFLYE